MAVSVVTALLGALGAPYVASRFDAAAAMKAELPGAAIGLLIGAPFLFSGLRGAERFPRLPPLAFLVEDPQRP